jgi:hypothetical protein
MITVVVATLAVVVHPHDHAHVQAVARLGEPNATVTLPALTYLSMWFTVLSIGYAGPWYVLESQSDTIGVVNIQTYAWCAQGNSSTVVEKPGKVPMRASDACSWL